MGSEELEKQLAKMVGQSITIATDFQKKRVPMFFETLSRGLKGFGLTTEQEAEIASIMVPCAWQIIQVERIYNDDRIEARSSGKYAKQAGLMILLVAQMARLGMASKEDAKITVATLEKIQALDLKIGNVVGSNFKKGKLKTKSRFVMYAKVIEILRHSIPKSQNLNGLLTLIAELNNILLPEYKISVATLRTEYNAAKRAQK